MIKIISNLLFVFIMTGCTLNTYNINVNIKSDDKKALDCSSNSVEWTDPDLIDDY